jgi:hypothetical protein
MLLIMIAAFYLAFAAYFGVASAWRLETAVVVAFVAIALPGASLPFALILGYSLHGLWDLLDELQAHGAYSAFEPGQLTPIPLAYGVFLCSFRLLHGGVFLYATRRVGCRVEGGAAQPVRAGILGSGGRTVQA